MEMQRRFFLTACLLLAQASLWADHVPPTPRLRVVATTTILADFVRQIGGDRVEITSLLRPGMEMHGFEPSPEDVRTISGAAVVVVNGLGLEGWIEKLLANSGFHGTLVVASKGIDPITGSEADPHCWQDVQNAIVMTTNVRDAMIAASPRDQRAFEVSAELYLGMLRALNNWTKRQFADVPLGRRKIVTSHDAFQYFARAYGFEIRSLSGAGEQETDAKHLAELIDWIRREKVAGIFSEKGASPKLVEQTAREAGAPLAGELLSDSLTAPGTPGDSYIGLMKTNVLTILRVLN